MSPLLFALVAFLSVTVALAQDAASSFEELLSSVRADSVARSSENQARERLFLDSRDQQQALLDQAKQELDDETTRSDRLKAQFDTNETDLTGLTETLRVRVGNMGELFGVVRQVAGDTK